MSEYEGYEEITNPESLLKAGDAVRYNGAPPAPCGSSYGFYISSYDGSPLSHVLKSISTSTHGAGKSVRVFRKIPPPRILPGNKHYSAPLPLP